MQDNNILENWIEDTWKNYSKAKRDFDSLKIIRNRDVQNIKEKYIANGFNMEWIMWVIFKLTIF